MRLLGISGLGSPTEAGRFHSDHAGGACNPIIFDRRIRATIHARPPVARDSYTVRRFNTSLQYLAGGFAFSFAAFAAVFTASLCAGDFRQGFAFRRFDFLKRVFKFGVVHVQILFYDLFKR